MDPLGTSCQKISLNPIEVLRTCLYVQIRHLRGSSLECGKELLIRRCFDSFETRLRPVVIVRREKKLDTQKLELVLDRLRSLANEWKTTKGCSPTRPHNQIDLLPVGRSPECRLDLEGSLE